MFENGVDVSYAQGNYRPGSESFVIINASRANIGLAVGSMYGRQVSNARAAGKHVGHYFFNGNINPATCADFFVANLDYQPGDSLWLDCESEPSTGTVAWTPGQAAVFNARVMAHGLPCPGTYLNRSLMDGYDWSPVVKQGSRLWIAYYNPTPPPIQWWPTWTVWQYTSLPMDLNRAQGSLTATAVTATPISTPKQEEDYSMTQGAFYRLNDGEPPIGAYQPGALFQQANPGEPLLKLTQEEWNGWAANKNAFVNLSNPQLTALINLVGSYDLDARGRRVPAEPGRASFNGFSVYLP